MIESSKYKAKYRDSDVDMTVLTSVFSDLNSTTCSVSLCFKTSGVDHSDANCKLSLHFDHGSAEPMIFVSQDSVTLDMGLNAKGYLQNLTNLTTFISGLNVVLFENGEASFIKAATMSLNPKRLHEALTGLFCAHLDSPNRIVENHDPFPARLTTTGSGI